MPMKILLRTQSNSQSLEKVLTAVHECAYKLRSLMASLSVDRSTYYLTMELEGNEQINSLTNRLGLIRGVVYVGELSMVES